MNRLIKITALAVFFSLITILSFSLLSQEQEISGAPGSNTTPPQNPPLTGESPVSPDSAEEPPYDSNNFLPDEQDVFSSKLFQRKLNPLTREEKIIWAFRIADKYTFL